MSRAFLWRLVLAGGLAATIALHTRLTMSAPFDARERVGSLVTKAGAELHASEADNENPLSPIVFDLPGCAGPVHVIAVSLNLHESPFFAKAIKPDYERRFFYLDRQWTTVDRLGLRLTWLKEKLLSMIGLARFDTTATALLVAEPEGCGAFTRLDWPAVWAR